MERFGRRLTAGIRAQRKMRRRARSELLVDPDLRFVYCPVPKVACTSLKRAFFPLPADASPGSQPSRDFHLRVRDRYGIERFDRRQQSYALSSPDVLRFCFVRDPRDRIASAYLDKFVRARRLEDFTVAAIERTQRLLGLPDDPDRGITFAEFVRYLSETPDRKLDGHWRSQVAIVGALRPGFVGRFEQLEVDFRELARRTGVDTDLPTLNRNSYLDDAPATTAALANLVPSELRAFASLPRPMDMYDAELTRAVERRYRRDIVRFRYRFSRTHS